MNGACVRNDTCSCSEGFVGEFCEVAGISITTCIITFVHPFTPLLLFLVESECETNICENGATCKLLAGDYTCECLPNYSGPFCQDEDKGKSNMSAVINGQVKYSWSLWICTAYS